MATIADLQTALTALEAQVTKNTDAEASGVALLNQLADIIRQNANDPAAIQAIADGISNQAGLLNTSADSLIAAVLANTPAQP